MASRFFLLAALSIYGSLGKAVEEPTNLMALQAVAGNMNKFSSELYEVTGKPERGNFVSSPISVSTALSMLTYGAGGKTQHQLKIALHFNNDETVQKKGLQTLVETLNDSPKVDLKVANRIFVAEKFNIKSEFQKLTESIFKSSTQKVDYSNSQEASRVINQWCEQQTNSKIKEMVKSDDLGQDTAMVLVNAVYFNGKWSKPFKTESTSFEPFYLEDGTTKNVSTMHGSRKYNYGVLRKFGAKFVELPYEDESMSMIIILPDNLSGLRDLESNLNEIPVSSLLKGYEVIVDISLPKFKIESKIELKEPLVKLGIEEMFENSANLRGIADSTLLKVTKIVQKAFIEVNEEGTEAAAATGLQVSTYSAPLHVDFHVNRPFYYAIVKRLSRQGDGVVLFHGHYRNVD